MSRKIYYFVFTLLEYIAFTCILYHIIRNLKFRKIILLLSLLFLFFLLANYAITSYNRIDSIPIGVESILLFIYIFYYLFNSLKEIENKSLYKGPELWLVTGMLVYLGSTFFFNILANSLDTHFMHNYWHFSFFGDILKNILFFIGIFYYVKLTAKNKKGDGTIDDLLSI